MTKKENKSKVGNNSLLQTARTKTFGAGKFALHALQTKSKPKPPVKKIKIPVRLPSTNVGGRSEIPGEGSKVSDITSSVGEESPLKRPGIVKEVRNGGKPDDKDIEIESSVMEMSINSGNSFPLSPLGANKNKSGDVMTNKQKVAHHQSTAFSFLWTKPAAGVNRSPKNLKSKNLAKSPKPIKSGVTVPRKKTMDISRGVRFSAPAPMTLNRCQLQMGQEKTAPESKEYLKMQAQNEREQQQKLEAEHMAEAKRFVEERLKEEFEWEEEGLGFEAQLNEFNIDVRKKSLVKKILRKIRPKSKGIGSRPKSKGIGSAIEAAMAAAAAAVDAAIESNPKNPDDESLSEEKARAIAKTALMASKEKNKEKSAPNFLQQLVSRTNQIPLTTLPYSDVVTTVDSNGVSLHFPVKEVMMKSKEDSVSDLDASIRNSGKVPVSEIHMNDAEQAHDDESVSTLGTPRIFEQLDKLLSTEHDGANQHVLGGSAAPPPMVTSHDAKALIDQSDSGTMVGDTTTGTLEDEVDPWHTAIGCFPSQQKTLIMEASTHNNIGLQKQRNSNRVRARIEEISDDGIETSFEEQPSHDDEDTKSSTSLTSVHSLAIDNAIRKAEMQIATGNGEKKDEESPLSPILEVDEVVSPTAINTARDAKSPLHIPFAPGIMRTVSASPITPRSTEVAREAKLSSYLPIAPGVLRSVPVPSDDLPEMNNMKSQHSQQPVSFDKFNNIAASKLHMTIDHSQDQHQHDRYSTEIDDSPRKNISDKTGIKKAGKDETNEATPKIRGDGEKHFFESDNPPHFSDGEFDLLPSTPHNKTQEMVFDLTQVNSKGYEKTQVKFVPLAEMDQGTFLLEKDDAYWDTLSTIASTANDRSSESDEYMDEFVPPGPIPGEITTSDSDIKTEKAAFVTISGQLLPPSPQVAPPPLNQESGCEENQVPAAALITIHESSQDSAHSGNASAKDTPGGNVSSFNEGSSRPEKKMETAEGFTRSQGNVDDVINDVTDLIDADLLLHQSSNAKNSNAYNALFETERELVGFNISGNDFHLGNASQKSSTSKMKSLMTNQSRPCPEISSQDRSRKNIQNKNPSLPPIRNVSWGFEEIYEDSNPRLDQSDQGSSTSAFSLGDRSRSGSRRGSSQIPKSQPSPEDMRSTTILQSNDTLLTGLDEQDLLSRTLELSKGLLQTIMGRQDIKEHEEQERTETSRSRDARGKLHNDNKNHTRKQFTPPDTRDDFHYQENRSAASNVIEKSEDDIPPIMIQNRLETLRRQRAQSLAKFRLSQTPVSEERFSYSRFSEPKRRDRDRLKYYTSSHDVGKPTTTTSISDRVKNSDYLQSYTDDTDIELKYTTSDSNISVTPSQKARDLRIQLDEAMKASKEIQLSQQKLGSELSTFKSSFKKKYYTRNGEIEDYARNAIGVERR